MPKRAAEIAGGSTPSPTSKRIKKVKLQRYLWLDFSGVCPLEILTVPTSIPELNAL
jgi:hypothetical protein